MPTSNIPVSETQNLALLLERAIELAPSGRSPAWTGERAEAFAAEVLGGFARAHALPREEAGSADAAPGIYIGVVALHAAHGGPVLLDGRQRITVLWMLLLRSHQRLTQPDPRRPPAASHPDGLASRLLDTSYGRRRPVLRAPHLEALNASMLDGVGSGPAAPGTARTAELFSRVSAHCDELLEGAEPRTYAALARWILLEMHMTVITARSDDAVHALSAALRLPADGPH